MFSRFVSSWWTTQFSGKRWSQLGIEWTYTLQQTTLTLLNGFQNQNSKNNTHANGLYLIETHKTEIVYDKPVYVGCCVLDLSKLHMMDFHYNVIQAQIGNKAKFIYSDTDSFVYEIEHNNIYEWIKENKEHFDLSKSERPDLKCNDNEHVLGKFKDELHSMVMTEMLGLNPKCYAFRFQKKKRIYHLTKLKNLKAYHSQPLLKHYHSKLTKKY